MGNRHDLAVAMIKDDVIVGHVPRKVHRRFVVQSSQIFNQENGQNFG